LIWAIIYQFLFISLYFSLFCYTLKVLVKKLRKLFIYYYQDLETKRMICLSLGTAHSMTLLMVIVFCLIRFFWIFAFALQRNV